MSETIGEPRPAKGRGLRWWAWTLIALAGVVVLTVPVLGVVGLFAYVEHSVNETSPDQPFLKGAAQQPDAESPLPASSPTDAVSADPDHWVVVTFEDTADTFDLETMDDLLETELSADEALRSAGIGWIDGNEVGEHQYDLYFVGTDREEMWGILKPIFASAPIPWSRAELRAGSEDGVPIVIQP